MSNDDDVRYFFYELEMFFKCGCWDSDDPTLTDAQRETASIGERKLREETER